MKFYNLCKTILFTLLLFVGISPLFANKIEEGIIVSLETKNREFLDGENLATGIRIVNRGNTPFIVDTYGKFKENSVRNSLCGDTFHYRKCSLCSRGCTDRRT